MDRLEGYINKRSCGILGLGVSNLPLAERLCNLGISLTVYDKKTPSELGEGALALEARGVRFVSGANCFDRISEGVIFRSPGIRPDIPAIKTALERGAELTSEIELLLEFSSAESFAVTGSDGKTTTTTLTGRFLEELAVSQGDKAFVGGNIGTPLLTRYNEMTERDLLTLELSSFQLMTVKKAPENIAITNITPNHLDWHGEMGEYIGAKKNIIGKETKRAVVNFENEITLNIGIFAAKEGKEVIFFSSKATRAEDILDAVPAGCFAVFEKNGKIVISDRKTETELLSVDSIRVLGRHNLENFMTAIALTYGRVSAEIYKTVAEAFFGVEHRLEWVRNLDGVDYYNSSIDSSPTRTAAALSALGSRDIVIICGGYDKKIPFEPLAEALFERARAVVLTGATGGKILDAINKYGAEHPEAKAPKIACESDFEKAVYKARELAEALGKRSPCVLLSPACASFDSFKNFAERGNTFKKLVSEL